MLIDSEDPEIVDDGLADGTAGDRFLRVLETLRKDHVDMIARKDKPSGTGDSGNRNSDGAMALHENGREEAAIAWLDDEIVGNRLTRLEALAQDRAAHACECFILGIRRRFELFGRRAEDVTGGGGSVPRLPTYVLGTKQRACSQRRSGNQDPGCRRSSFFGADLLRAIVPKDEAKNRDRREEEYNENALGAHGWVTGLRL